MCELCSKETRDMARSGHAMRAQQLRELAARYEGIAAGRIKPHSDEIKSVARTASHAIRFLAEDWL